jgi:hypothetical protein
VLLTLAGVIGGYALASHWHLSGPLAMVMMGLMVGNRGRELAMSDKTRHYIDLFWELIDEILNAILFCAYWSRSGDDCLFRQFIYCEWFDYFDCACCQIYRGRHDDQDFSSSA